MSRRKFIKTLGAASLAIPLLGFSKSAVGSYDPTDENPILKPPALKPGDTIGITCPATAVWQMETINKFFDKLKAEGFKLKIGKTITEKYGYFAGTDEVRAKELNDFIVDKEVQAIFCAKGGYGCARLLDMINYDVLKKNPKVIMGFSDITALLLAINKKTGLITYHGPVGNSGLNDFTWSSLKAVLIEKGETFYENKEKVTINPGKAKGILIGGNLSVLTSIIGSDYLSSFDKKILFLEDAEEEPYSIDRMLTQLKLSGFLKNITGIIFGKCAKCVAEEPDKAFTYEQMIDQNIKPLGIPAFYNASFGHVENKSTLPIGIMAEMDSEKGTIKLLESAVS